MKLPIYLYGHPVLRKVSADISSDYLGLSQLLADMYETMYASDGVGLAAPQIGRNDRIIVIDASPLAETMPELDGVKLTLINPRLEVLDDGPCETRGEGWPEPARTERECNTHRESAPQWLDENFEAHDRVFEGFLSRIIQHEYDHLEGHVYIDHISPIRKQLIRRKLSNIVEGKVRCDYPVRYAPRKK